MASSSSSKLSLSGQPTAHHTVLVAAPTSDALEDAEIYEELLSAEDAGLCITERAAEVRVQTEFVF